MSWQNIDKSRRLEAHYAVMEPICGAHDEIGCMQALRQLFPTAKPDYKNIVLFSTSGVHGTYNTIEDCEKTIRKKWTPEEIADGYDCDTVTFLVIHPRLVALRYGNCKVETLEDIRFLKKLRAGSMKALAQYNATNSKD